MCPMPTIWIWNIVGVLLIVLPIIVSAKLRSRYCPFHRLPDRNAVAGSGKTSRRGKARQSRITRGFTTDRDLRLFIRDPAWWPFAERVFRLVVGRSNRRIMHVATDFSRGNGSRARPVILPPREFHLPK
jgi:hypothetical protein